MSMDLIMPSNQMKGTWWKNNVLIIKVNKRSFAHRNVDKCKLFCSFNSLSYFQRAPWRPTYAHAQARAQTVARSSISVQSSCSASASQVCICGSGQMIRFSGNSRVKRVGKADTGRFFTGFTGPKQPLNAGSLKRLNVWGWVRDYLSGEMEATWKRGPEATFNHI